MLFQRFNDSATNALITAQHQARELGHGQVSPAHLLLGVLADEAGLGGRVLRQLELDLDTLIHEIRLRGNGDDEALHTLGIDLDAVRQQAEQAFGPGALDRPVRRRRTFFARRDNAAIPFTPAAREALERSLPEALALGHTHIGTEHIVFGLIADDATPAARLLDRLGIAPSRVRERLRKVLDQAS